MARKKPASISKKRLYYLLTILSVAGFILVGGAAYWKQISPESMEKELILQIGARECSNAGTADGSVGRPTKSLVDLIKEVVTGSNQQYDWVPDLIRDLGIALWISVIVTFLVEKYASRGEGERLVREAFSATTLIRPSVMFRRGDAFVTPVARMLRRLPIFPLFGRGQTQLQPAHVEDVAEAIARAMQTTESRMCYELGGPRVYTYRSLLEMIARHLGKELLLVPDKGS